MSETTGTQKLLYPGLAGFYATVADFSYVMVRVVLGCILFMHGWVKFTGPGLAGVTGYFDKNGFPFAVGFAAAAIFLETVGALCLALGLFTRFFAAAVAIELAVALLVIHLPNGFSAGKGGYEYVLLLGVVTFAIALRGGGPYSIDRLIGKEL